MEDSFKEKNLGESRKRINWRFYVIIIILMIVLICLFALLFLALLYNPLNSDKKMQSDLENNLYSNNALNYNSNDIQIIPITLNDYLNHWFITEKSGEKYAREYRNRELIDINSKAAPAGVKVIDEMNSKYVVSSNGSSYFAAFFDYKRAQNCKRDYLIQRVRLTKRSLNINGSENTPDTKYYLVEVWRLSDTDKTTFIGDRHTRQYELFDDFKKEYTAEIEVGCGIIPGKLEGDDWPYDSLGYKLIQGYSTNEGMYDNVVFDFSLNYEIKGSFDLLGSYSMNVDTLNISVVHEAK